MTKAIRGSRATIYVDSVDASAFLNEYSIEAERDDLEFTPFGSDDKEYLSGPSENTVTLTGAWNGDEDSLDALLDATFGTDTQNIVTVCAGGVTSGKACYLVAGTQITYNTEATTEDITTAEAEFRSGRRRGRVLQQPVTVTATGNGSAHTATAATAKGASAHLHVLDVTGAPTSVEIVVEHSVDGTVWTPLITFGAVTGKGAQRVATLDTATVNVQVRARHTITGGTTPSVRYVVAFARHR